MKKVKDHNIGMGLACSKSIIRQLGGDVVLKESKKGRTIFKVNLPIESLKGSRRSIEEISSKDQDRQ